MQAQVYTVIPRTHVVTALTQLRQEWQCATDRSLLAVNGNVALMLADVTMSIGLDSVERLQVFGAELAQELDEVLALSDRILVLYRGRIQGELEPAKATEEQVGILMAGGRIEDIEHAGKTAV